MCSAPSTVLGMLRPLLVAFPSPVQLRIMSGRKLTRVASSAISINSLVIVWSFSCCVPSKPIPITNHNPTYRYVVLFGYAHAYLSSSLFCTALVCVSAHSRAQSEVRELRICLSRNRNSINHHNLSPDTQPPSQFVA